MNDDKPASEPTLQGLDKRLRKLEGEAADRTRQADNISRRLDHGPTTTDVNRLNERLDRIERRIDEIEKKLS